MRKTRIPKQRKQYRHNELRQTGNRKRKEITLKHKILIVEDDRTISHFMAKALEDAGYLTVTAENGKNARALFQSHLPSLVLLDLGLPDEDGLMVMGQMKMSRPEIPVVVVSARIWEEEKVKALDMGADDYIIKPFGVPELLARIRTALRHAAAANRAPRDGQEDVFSQNGLTLDVPHHRVTLDGETIHFTAHEFQILELLLRHKGQVLTYAWMIRQIWGTYIATDNQILRVNVANIRRKLHEDPANPRFIQTELGVGYRLIDGE